MAVIARIILILGISLAWLSDCSSFSPVNHLMTFKYPIRLSTPSYCLHIDSKTPLTMIHSCSNRIYALSCNVRSRSIRGMPVYQHISDANHNRVGRHGRFSFSSTAAHSSSEGYVSDYTTLPYEDVVAGVKSVAADVSALGDRVLKNRYYGLRHGESEANIAGIISSDPSIGK